MHSITSAASAIRQGEFTPSDLLEQCLQRIDELESRIQAWVFVDRDGAREQAARLTREIQSGIDRGPLHGIPIGVKDLFDVFDWPTAAGSKRWAQSYARQDCPTIAQLRKAGAVLVGKTVTTAYAAFDPPVTKNPWNADRTPGGSSSGSGAAVACGMVPAALGTQTGGSITRPAAYCGVYGLKPTYGRVSLEGVVPLSTSLDHGGVLAGSVQDCALVFQAMVKEEALRGVVDYTASTGHLSWKLVALGGYFETKAEPVMKKAFDALLEKLNTSWEVSRRPLPVSFLDIPQYHRTIMSVEATRFHGERWRRHPEDYPPKFTSLLEQGKATSGADYLRCKDHQQAVRATTVDWVGVDGSTIIVPATSGPAPDTSTIGEPTFQGPWSYSGLPTISLPFDWTAEGLPLCVQLVGKANGEAELLAVARTLEKSIGFEKRKVS